MIDPNREMDSIAKIWAGCRDGFHWAFYLFRDKGDRDYWTREYYDKLNGLFYRHEDFMSIPCFVCGAYSPLRASTQFLTPGAKSCKLEQVVNYRPDEKLPDILGIYRENGWVYIYFKETLSDSLCGQETFRLRE